MTTEHWVVEFNNEWKQLTDKYNWYTFTLIYIYGEKSYDGYELWLTLFGLGIYIRYNTTKSLEADDPVLYEKIQETN